MADYDTTRLEQLAKRYKRHTAEVDAIRPDLQTEVLAALAAGVRQVEITRITGWTRDNVRQLTNRRRAG